MTDTHHKILTARVSDAVAGVVHGKNGFIGFLDLHERTVCENHLKFIRFDNFLFCGGLDNAERTVLGLFAGEPDSALFPISCVNVTYPNNKALTHRDFLGTLLSLGIQKHTVGDIIVSEGVASLLLRSDIAHYVRDHLRKVGGVGVEIIGDDTPLNPQIKFLELRKTIASERLDCIIATLLDLSRTQATVLIRSGRVSIDFTEEKRPDVRVNGGQTVSVRGHGRFLIDSVCGKTRKNRIVLEARKLT